jgi:hypothetical protein
MRDWGVRSGLFPDRSRFGLGILLITLAPTACFSMQSNRSIPAIAGSA